MGAEGYKASESAVQSVVVNTKVTLNLSTTDLRLGREVTFSGAVSPAHLGSVTLTITQPNGQVVTRTADLRSSSYSFKYKPPARGDYTVVASFAAHDDHGEGKSDKKPFRVR